MAEGMSGRMAVRATSSSELRNSHQVDDLATSAGPVTRTGSSWRRRLILADTIAVLAGFATAFVVLQVFRPTLDRIVAEHILLMVVSLPGFGFGAATTRLHLARANERPSQEAMNIVRTVGIGVAVMVTFGFALQFRNLSRLWVMVVMVAVTALLLIERAIARKVFARLRANGRLCRRIVIVGTDAHAVGLMHTYQRNPELGYHVVGFVGDDDIGDRGGVEVLGPLDLLDEILGIYDVGGVVVSLSSIEDRDVNQLARRLTDQGYHVAVSLGLLDIDMGRLRPQVVDGRTMIYVEPVIRSGWRAMAKRVFDVVWAAAVLVLTAPVVLVAIIAIKLDSRGPVLFRQTRVGRNGELFTMLKLRTMTVDAEARRAELLDRNEADGPLFKITHDPRITRVGRLLRKLSIDEIPQLLCVLRGTMSMVGPRPALPDEATEWDEPLCDRLRVLPGLTGMWQVSGRSDATFEQYRRLDLYYVDNWSLLHDLRICVRTVGVVARGRGAA